VIPDEDFDLMRESWADTIPRQYRARTGKRQYLDGNVPDHLRTPSIVLSACRQDKSPKKPPPPLPPLTPPPPPPRHKKSPPPEPEPEPALQGVNHIMDKPPPVPKDVLTPHQQRWYKAKIRRMFAKP